jgi:hypothetical protein
MKWNVALSCSSCDVAPIQWTDDGATPTAGAHWTYDPTSDYPGRWGTVVTRWTGTGKEQIDLDWSITASVAASNSLDATADFGSSGIDVVRELAPRCDDITRGAVTPGCVFPFFKPTVTVDTNVYPAAGAYYWLMQEHMPDHAGSKKWDSLLHYLGPDTTVKNPTTGAGLVLGRQSQRGMPDHMVQAPRRPHRGQHRLRVRSRLHPREWRIPWRRQPGH